MTRRLDDCVARFYRAMRTGYQAQIDRILAAFARIRIAQVRKSGTQIERLRGEEHEIARMEAERRKLMG